MFDVSYQTMLELVEGMREFVKENLVESNLREMGRACIETYAIRPLEDRDDHSLYLGKRITSCVLTDFRHGFYYKKGIPFL